MATLTLLSLPGEVRNQILQCCIDEAKRVPVSKKLSPGDVIYNGSFRNYPVVKRSLKDLEVDVLPRWTGDAQIKTVGIKRLPLLFVNKQIYQEVSSLVDSMVFTVTIGPYGVQFANEDPNLRWDMAYQLLRRRPHLLQNVQKVKVFLPWLRLDMVRMYWRNMGHKWVNKDPNKSYGLSVIPGLFKCLQLFQSLSALEITLVAETRDPPDFKPLLKLYDLCGTLTDIHIIGMASQDPSLWGSQDARKWTDAWSSCLLEHTRTADERDELSSEMHRSNRDSPQQACEGV